MEPRTEYATTRDGISIAYWSIGDGAPLVLPPPALPWSHAQEEWQIPEWRHWYEHLAKQFRLIRYDNRGSGLSERDIGHCDHETDILDLEAVVDASGAERVDIFGFYYSGAPAITFAARHPERVSHLLLWCAFSCADDMVQQVQFSDTMRTLMDMDWELFTETIAHAVFGWAQGDPAHRVAQYMRAAATREVVRRHWESHQRLDVRGDAARVQSPTLVMHRRQFPLVGLGAARQLTALIPEARLAVLDGASLAPYVGDMASALRAIDEFTGGDGRMLDGEFAEERRAGGFRAIMFTDIPNSTEATQRFGDEPMQDLLRAHNDVVRDALHAYGGTEVKHTGDGIMASFTSAVLAVECAIRIQRRLHARNDAHPDGRPVVVRIGVNAGEPVAEGDDLFGTSVQLASRICAHAEPGQVLVSDVVRQLVAGKGFLFSDRGDAALRGFDEPVRLYEARWRADGA